MKTLICALAICVLFVTGGCGGGGGGNSPTQPHSTRPQPPTTQPPIALRAPVCTADVSVVSQDGLAVAVSFDAPVIDRMGRPVTAVCSPPPGSLFEVGTHDVTCERSDHPGARCAFSVTVAVDTDPISGGICARTAQVRNAIVDRIPGVHTCSAVTDAHLAAVTGLLNLNDTAISNFKFGDFSGLTRLRSLLLTDNQLTTLPADIFDPKSGSWVRAGLRKTLVDWGDERIERGPRGSPCG